MNPILRWFRNTISSPSRVSLALILAGLVLCIMLFGKILAPVLAGIMLAYLLDGPVSWLTRLRLPRKPAVFLIFTLFLSLLILTLVLLVPFLIEEVAKLARQAPEMLAKFKLWVASLPAKRPGFISEEQYLEVLAAMRANTDIASILQQKVSSYGENLIGRSLQITQGALTLLIHMILIPLMTLFFLKDKDQIIAWFRQFQPDNMGLARRVWTEVDLQFSNYIRGRFYEILIIWGVTYVTFRILGLQYAMLLGVFTGLAVLLPYIGTTLMAIPPLLIALFQPNFSGMEVAMTMLAYGVIHFLDGNILAPLLLSEVTSLHPVAIIVSFLVFGALWGFWGVFFAIPLGSLANAVIKAWMSKQSEGEDEQAHPAP